ncbi:hypothetical protein Tco_0587727 [Tanacetum coccineum]
MIKALSTKYSIEIEPRSKDFQASQTDLYGISRTPNVWYGYIKNHKKTVKNKQTRTRERKSEQKPEAKPGKVKPPVNLGQQKSTTKDKIQNIPL